MGSRSTHPIKEIEAAIAEAEQAGWRVTQSNGHAWGRLWCPQHDRDGCVVSIWSTPKNPTAHARDLARAVKRCDHCREEKEDGGV